MREIFKTLESNEKKFFCKKKIKGHDKHITISNIVLTALFMTLPD